MKYLSGICCAAVFCGFLTCACGDQDLLKWDTIEGVKNWTPEVSARLIYADYDVWKLVNQHTENADIVQQDGRIIIRHEEPGIWSFDAAAITAAFHPGTLPSAITLTQPVTLEMPLTRSGMDISFWNKFKGDIRLAEPQVKVTVANEGLNLPFDVYLNVSAYGENGRKLDFRAGTPLSFTWTEAEETKTLAYDKHNSNLGELVYFPPTNGIEYSGKVIVNPQGESIESDGNGKAVLGVAVEVPLKIQSSDMSFTDTVKTGSIDADMVDKIMLARIRVAAVNNIPVELGAGHLLLLDKNRRLIDEIEVEKFIDAPEVDAAGNVTAAGDSSHLIPLTEENIASLADTEYIVVAVGAKTAGENVFVEIKPEATLSLVLHLEVRFDMEDF